MKDPVYIIGNGRVVDIMPLDAWDSLSYFDIIDIYNLTQDPQFQFKWVLTIYNTWESTPKSKIALVP